MYFKFAGKSCAILGVKVVCKWLSVWGDVMIVLRIVRSSVRTMGAELARAVGVGPRTSVPVKDPESQV